MEKIDNIGNIDKIVKLFDNKAFTIEAGIIYNNREGFIITNDKENYHFAINIKNNKNIIFDIKKDPLDNKYIPDFNRSVEIRSLNTAIAKLYAEVERKKILNFFKKINNRLLNGEVSGEEYVELIISESITYGIKVKKIGKNLFFENNTSIMDIRKKNLEKKEFMKSI